MLKVSYVLKSMKINLHDLFLEKWPYILLKMVPVRNVDIKNNKTYR